MQCNEVTHYRRQQLTFDVLLTKEPPTGRLQSLAARPSRHFAAECWHYARNASKRHDCLQIFKFQENLNRQASTLFFNNESNSHIRTYPKTCFGFLVSLQKKFTVSIVNTA